MYKETMAPKKPIKPKEIEISPDNPDEPMVLEESPHRYQEDKAQQSGPQHAEDYPKIYGVQNLAESLEEVNETIKGLESNWKDKIDHPAGASKPEQIANLKHLYLQLLQDKLAKFKTQKLDAMVDVKYNELFEEIIKKLGDVEARSAQIEAANKVREAVSKGKIKPESEELLMNTIHLKEAA